MKLLPLIALAILSACMPGTHEPREEPCRASGLYDMVANCK